jgi:hypothetical protein
MDSATPTIFSGLFVLIVVGELIYFFAVSVRILKEYERDVIFRLGRCIGTR